MIQFDERKFFFFFGLFNHQLDDIQNLGGGFKYFVFLTPNPGEHEPILTHIFQMGWFNHQLDIDYNMLNPSF